MATEDRELGHLEADMETVKGQVNSMQGDISQLKDDVHDVKVILAELRTEVRALTKRQSPFEVLYAFLIFAAVAYGVFVHVPPIGEWLAGAGILLGVLVLQRTKLGGVVSQYIGAKRGGTVGAS